MAGNITASLVQDHPTEVTGIEQAPAPAATDIFSLLPTEITWRISRYLDDHAIHVLHTASRGLHAKLDWPFAERFLSTRTVTLTERSLASLEAISRHSEYSAAVRLIYVSTDAYDAPSQNYDLAVEETRRGAGTEDTEAWHPFLPAYTARLRDALRNFKNLTAVGIHDVDRAIKEEGQMFGFHADLLSEVVETLSHALRGARVYPEAMHIVTGEGEMEYWGDPPKPEVRPRLAPELMRNVTELCIFMAAGANGPWDSFRRSKTFDAYMSVPLPPLEGTELQHLHVAFASFSWRGAYQGNSADHVPTCIASVADSLSHVVHLELGRMLLLRYALEAAILLMPKTLRKLSLYEIILYDDYNYEVLNSIKRGTGAVGDPEAAADTPFMGVGKDVWTRLFGFLADRTLLREIELRDLMVRTADKEFGTAAVLTADGTTTEFHLRVEDGPGGSMPELLDGLAKTLVPVTFRHARSPQSLSPPRYRG